ncbi:glycoside hydrolase family 3 protein [Gaoshiqia sediminis]|uniref:beta-glucosidase n=1 Tax=Gaoshiqia sediminis TaxID=2986998 RepID=A0AA41YDI3_9BACT|nr:glycoside hydrolase family 3 N-terminal domain-containing protein [Gaoshiqia sediminis]MCW0483402.1 glycoside hydrolase family 3 C-terminal domain-containing protein [Gaoshiqia sediminis]
MKNIFHSLFYFLIVVFALILIAVFVFNAYYRTLNNKAKKQLRETLLVVDDGFEFRDLNKNGKLDPYEDFRQPVDIRVEDLLSQMTIDEKVGLMWHPPIGIEPGGGLQGKPGMMSPSSTFALLINKRITHFNLFTVPGTRELANWSNQLQKLAEQTRLGIPVTISTDPRHGLTNFIGAGMLGGNWSKWPEPIGLAAAGDSALVVDFGRIARQEYRAVGIHTALHPMADLATEPRWARINGTFGEDAHLAAKMVAAYIYGFQGDKLDSGSVACMTKHWPGAGPQENGEDAHFSYGKNQSYPGNNFNYHLIPFEAAMKANTAMMMPYYGIAHDQTSENVGMGFNRKIITELLREKYGYDGVVCSDWGIIEGFSFLGYEVMGAKNWGLEKLPVEERIRKALEAGIDQFGGNTNTAQLLRLLRRGDISESRINESARRLLRLKFKLGLFDNPFVDPDEAVRIVNNKEFEATGKLAQRKSIVLLKNQQQQNGQFFLPLSKGIKVYAENLDKVELARYATVVDRLQEADVALFRLQTPFEPRSGDFMESLFHQGYLDFQEPELSRLVNMMAQKPTVVCMYMDRPAVIPEIKALSKGLLVDFGAEDDAVLDVVFGEFNPGARLPFEIPSSMDAVLRQKEDVPYDSEKPLFPFGFGLSYQ